MTTGFLLSSGMVLKNVGWLGRRRQRVTALPTVIAGCLLERKSAKATAAARCRGTCRRKQAAADTAVGE
jgi:hypothetical protein